MAHVPKEVLAKNFQTDMSAFDHIPGEELYIFPAGRCRDLGCPRVTLTARVFRRGPLP